MNVATLYLTREEAFGLKVGGLERVTCWLARPQRQGLDDFLGKPSWGWASPVSQFSARAFHVIGATDVARAIWRAVQETAFPEIDYEDWDGHPEGRQPLKIVTWGGPGIPLGRVGEPEEIAKAVLFLASNEASFVNRNELFVDGGQAQI
ncbi:Enoyl-(Acyl carrier protein) reductase [Bosea sp. TND4EK4]|nr:Enoyl-(Acyl carrier protein) reductase [Bosea sp. TND4EK4]